MKLPAKKTCVSPRYEFLGCAGKQSRRHRRKLRSLAKTSRLSIPSREIPMADGVEDAKQAWRSGRWDCRGKSRGRRRFEELLNDPSFIPGHRVRRRLGVNRH